MNGKKSMAKDHLPEVPVQVVWGTLPVPIRFSSRVIIGRAFTYPHSLWRKVDALAKLLQPQVCCYDTSDMICCLFTRPLIIIHLLPSTFLVLG